MDFRLLGSLEVAEQDRLLDLGGVKQRSLLVVGPSESRQQTGLGRIRAAGSR
jgi:hypothetical protein